MNSGEYLRELNEHRGMTVTALAISSGLIVSGDETGKIVACY